MHSAVQAAEHAAHPVTDAPRPSRVSRVVDRARTLPTSPVFWVAAVLMVLNLIWMARDRRSPSWDQSSYLHVAHLHVEEFKAHGPFAYLHSIATVDGGRAPLFAMLVSVPMLFFGPNSNSALIVNVAAIPLLLWAVAGIARRVGGTRAVLPSLVAVGALPIVMGLSREVLVDFVLMSLCAATLNAVLLSDRFARRGWTIASGVLLGLAILTKVTAPVQIGVAGLVAIALGAGSLHPSGSVAASLRTRIVNVVLGFGGLFVATLWWYVPHLAETRDYIRSTTGGPLSLGAGPSQPLTAAALKIYANATINQHVSWPVFALMLVVAPVTLVFLVRAVRARVGRDRLWFLLQVSFPFAWLLPAYVLQAASHNQDQRLVAPAMVAVAVILGCAIGAVTARAVRLALTAVTAGVAALVLVMHTMVGSYYDHVGRIHWFDDGIGKGYLTLGNRDVGYLTAPQTQNRAKPVVDWLLAEARGRSLARPLVLGVLSTDPEINLNTIPWLVEAGGDTQTIVVRTPQKVGRSAEAIAADFASYDAVAVFPPEAYGNPRLDLLNSQLAAGPEVAPYLAQFTGPTQEFALTSGSGRVVIRLRPTS